MFSVSKLIPILVTALLGGCSVGCQALNPSPPIEAFANKLVDQAIVPAVKDGISQGVKNLQLQAGAQVINPTYEIEFEGKWVVGVEGKASVGVSGVAGQAQITAAGVREE